MARPSEQLDDLFSGRVSYEDSPKYIQSWAKFFLYKTAVNLVGSSKEMQRKIIDQIPKDLLPIVKDFVYTVRNNRRNGIK